MAMAEGSSSKFGAETQCFCKNPCSLEPIGQLELELISSHKFIHQISNFHSRTGARLQPPKAPCSGRLLGHKQQSSSLLVLAIAESLIHDLAIKSFSKLWRFSSIIFTPHRIHLTRKVTWAKQKENRAQKNVNLLPQAFPKKIAKITILLGFFSLVKKFVQKKKISGDPFWVGDGFPQPHNLRLGLEAFKLTSSGRTRKTWWLRWLGDFLHGERGKIDEVKKRQKKNDPGDNLKIVHVYILYNIYIYMCLLSK